MRILWKETGMPECGWPTEARLAAVRGFPRHTHDFAEVLWIVGGEAEHVSGVDSQPLRVGTLSCVAPGQEHGFLGGETTLRIHNTSLSPSFFEEFQRRHDVVAGTLWSAPERPPPVWQLGDASLARLENGFFDLRRSSLRAVDLERFLLNVFHEVDEAACMAGREGWPDWLVLVMRSVDDPQVMSGGTRALSEIAGRSPEHLSRVMRRLLNKTPTELLNEARVAYAAGQLTHTDRTVADVGGEVGFDSLGHFYHVFKQVRGHPPGRVRRASSGS